MPAILRPCGFAKIYMKTTLSKLLWYQSEVVFSKTFYHNHSNYGNWSDGPELIQARKYSSSGIVIDEATEEKLVVVTGGVGNDAIYLNSTEILIGNQWSLGEEIIILQFAQTLNPKKAGRGPQGPPLADICPPFLNG